MNKALVLCMAIMATAQVSASTMTERKEPRSKCYREFQMEVFMETYPHFIWQCKTQFKDSYRKAHECAKKQMRKLLNKLEAGKGLHG